MRIIDGYLSIGRRSMSSLRPLVICGPSGSGKSTLLKRLLKANECFSLSVSHTTRKPRLNEVNGVDYHFVSREEMEKAIENGDFIEHTQFSGNMYGTSKSAVRAVMEKGRICILDIEIEGVKNIKNTDLDPLYVFVKPPSLQELERRLRNRQTETEESLSSRLKRAVDEMAYGDEAGNFDLVIVNDDRDDAYASLESFLQKEIEDLSGKTAEF
ncbi:guanylate kinase [Galendromus occidentalis]|uniref:guanylate kinase n=1 Tax=Galendromus occidentalis TaxID=34638 RepID=A0AAJ6QXE7_9ACAR|nr:guanylate kinase [Galendromus occidentalis]